jgi:hypothetical protein
MYSVTRQSDSVEHAPCSPINITRYIWNNKQRKHFPDKLDIISTSIWVEHEWANETYFVQENDTSNLRKFFSGTRNVKLGNGEVCVGDVK